MSKTCPNYPDLMISILQFLLFIILGLFQGFLHLIAFIFGLRAIIRHYLAVFYCSRVHNFNFLSKKWGSENNMEGPG